MPDIKTTFVIFTATTTQLRTVFMAFYMHNELVVVVTICDNLNDKK